MLDLSEEQVKKFKEWRISFLGELTVRLDTVRRIKEDYEQDSLYQKINQVYTEVYQFTVTTEKAYINRKEICNQITFGAMAEKWKCQIEKIMEDTPDMFSARLKNLEEDVLGLFA